MAAPKIVPTQQAKPVKDDLGNYVTKSKFKELSANKPEGVSEMDLLAALQKKGKIVEGFNEDKMQNLFSQYK